MNKDTNKQPDDSVRDKIAEQAFSWLLQLEDADDIQAKQAAFAAWLKQSPLHVEEYLLTVAKWRELDGIDPDKTIDIDALLSEPAHNVMPLNSAHTMTVDAQTRPPRSRLTLFASAALLILSLAISVFFYQYTVPETNYATTLGEQKSFTLDDGTVVHMNTRTRIRVRYDDQVRKVDLLGGEALFQVSHDKTRPFRVVAAQTVVEALGTRFNVAKHDKETKVAVIEGKIAVTTLDPTKSASGSPEPATTSTANTHSLVLVAGEGAEVGNTGAIRKTDHIDTEQTLAWRQRRLVFRNDILTKVADEFNRYNKLQLIIKGGTVSNKKLTGVFDADDPTSLIDFLKTDQTLRISRFDDRIIISEY